MSHKIAIIGSSMIDFTTYSPRLPKPGETIFGTKYEQGFGGKGANQCVTAARLGASTVFITSLGSDSFGHEYKEKLKGECVDVSYVKIQDNIHTGIAQIIVSESGENSIVIVQGANSLLTPRDAIEAEKAIQCATVLLCQFEASISSTIEALKIHKGYGTSIVNGAPAISDVDPQIFKLADIFCVNETEVEVMTGIKNVTIENAQEAIDRLLSFGCNTVIITLGAQGAVFASVKQKKFVHVPTEAVRAVDTTGAGDAFLGALGYYIAYHTDLSLEECIRKSNKIASRSVMETGTQSSFPYRRDLPADLI